MRRNGRVVFVAALAAAALVTTTISASAAQRTPKRTNIPQIGRVINEPPGTKSPDVIGTITYDNNIPTARDGTLNVPVGNLFVAPWVPPGAHSIAQVSFRLAACFTTPYVGARALVHDINPTAMTVMQLVAFSAGAGPGVNCNAAQLYTGMLPAPIMGHTGPFFAGILNTPFAGCAGNTMIGGTCEGVALSMGGVDPGMGFHGARVNGNGYVALAPARNAIFRVTGDNLPVELMGFGVK